jgi:hypothetical protein
MDAWLEEMKAVEERTHANLKEMKVEIRAKNEKFKVLQSTLISWMDIHQARTEAKQEGLVAKREANYEGMADLKTQTGCLTSRTDINQEKLDAWLEEMKTWRKDMTACQERMAARLEKMETYLKRKDTSPVVMAKVSTS